MAAYQNSTVGDRNPYAVGNTVYGGVRHMPSIGPLDQRGYKERDKRYQARREAAERRLKALGKGRMINPDVFRAV